MPVENNYYTEMCSGSEACSYLRLIDLCIRLESNKEERRVPVGAAVADRDARVLAHGFLRSESGPLRRVVHLGRSTCHAISGRGD